MPLSKRRSKSTPARSKTPVLSANGALRRKLTRELFRDSVRMEADIGRDPAYLNSRAWTNPSVAVPDKHGLIYETHPRRDDWKKAQRKWMNENAR